MNQGNFIDHALESHLLDHEASPDLVKELVVVLALGPLVLARDLNHGDARGVAADRKVRELVRVADGVGFVLQCSLL